MNCSQIESLLPAYADGESDPAQTVSVERHLVDCAECRQAVSVQRAARDLLQARATMLQVLAAPGLRTRIMAATSAETATENDAATLLGWRGRLSAFAAAALVVLAVGAAAVPLATARSVVLLAAQLTLDHLKCFTIDGNAESGTEDPAEAESALRREYGWSVPVPRVSSEAGLQLVGVRRCLYGEGRAAHMLYRSHGQPISLFVLPGEMRERTSLNTLGHEQLVWNQGGHTYVLVGQRGDAAVLAQMASSIRNEAE